LTFSLKKNPAYKVDCRRLTPDKLADLSIEQILEITLNNAIKIVDLFDINGENIEQIVFKNGTAQLDFIGHQMSHGSITIEGDCGDFLGANMRGGHIVCYGDTGDRVGDQMRRGLLLIDGSAGDYCGSRMLAGTIGVYESVGSYAGFGMKRGTILLTRPADLHITLQDCGTHDLPFLKLLFNAIKPLKSKFSALNSMRAQRYGGDVACNGTGEVLVLK
ncbi:MAG TPA: formylmethanofuran dehydrogenase subunit C, partial [Methylotenera sp.]|nr:formylmethanofuran dehydrogenase subunit C [Methylotenera sp.]